MADYCDGNPMPIEPKSVEEIMDAFMAKYPNGPPLGPSGEWLANGDFAHYEHPPKRADVFSLPPIPPQSPDAVRDRVREEFGV
jgi:hypothetical protein